MPVEPEKILYHFPNRANRWKRATGYGSMSCRPAGSIQVVEYTIPATFSGARGRKIAFLSDIHYTGSPMVRQAVADAAGAIEAFEPDLLICGGDLAGYAADLPLQQELLRQLIPLAPVRLAVPGNWESTKRWLSAAFWAELYHQNGFLWLNNSFYQDPALVVYGAGDPSSGHIEPPQWPTDARQRLLIVHNPDTAIAFDSRRAPEQLPSLTLAGHTHGGQIRLPWLGALISSSQYGRFFDYGLYRHTATGAKMLISAGLGHLSFPWRWNCRREVVLLTFS